MKPLHRIATFAAAALLSIAAAQAQDTTPVVHVDNPPNAQAQQSKHYVILVSLDGFRYDYPTKYGAPHLLSMATNGASAPDGMLPSYPSITFPNHLTLVTGLYPEHHGIVGNTFFDPSRTPEQGQTYSYSQPKTNGDGSWYGGTPLWVLAEQQGMRSACLFWPGSEAAIQGIRPSYYLHFDDKLDDSKRVDQVIAWLNLPPDQRPHFITLYYSNVDHAGHLYGPESEEVRAAVHHVDDMIGDLQTKLAALKLPIDLVVVADHGMVTLKGDPINLGEFANLNGVHTDGSQIYPKDDTEAARIYAEFKAHPDPRFTVYRRADVPAHLHFNENPREGDPVVVPTGPYLFRTTPANPNMGRGGMSGTLHGSHGFDPSTMPEMKAIFFAQGPDIKPNTKLPIFENVNVYPLLAGILDLRAPIVDGTLSVLLPALSKAARSNAARAIPPSWLHQVEPETDSAIKEQLLAKDRDAKVVMTVEIDSKGHPSNIRIIRGTRTRFDQAATKAIKESSFTPAIIDGKLAPVQLVVEVRVSPASSPSLPDWNDKRVEFHGDKANTEEASTLEPPSSDKAAIPGFGGVSSPWWIDPSQATLRPASGQKGTSGTIVLAVRIEKDGHPSAIRVVNGVGKDMDQKAVEVIGHALFKPALKAGQPVVAEARIEMNFFKTDK